MLQSIGPCYREGIDPHVMVHVIEGIDLQRGYWSMLSRVSMSYGMEGICVIQNVYVIKSICVIMGINIKECNVRMSQNMYFCFKRA